MNCLIYNTMLQIRRLLFFLSPTIDGFSRSVLSLHSLDQLIYFIFCKTEAPLEILDPVRLICKNLCEDCCQDEVSPKQGIHVASTHEFLSVYHSTRNDRVGELLLSPFPTPMDLPAKRHAATRRHIYIYIYFLLIYICIYSHCSPTQADMPNSFASQKTHMYICEKTNLQNRAATGNTLSSKANTHASLRGFLPRGTCAAVTYRRNVDTFVFSSFSLSQSRFCGRASSATLSHSDGPACKTPCCRSNPASSS